MMEELEIIRHSQLDGLLVFINSMAYRTPHFHPEWELMWVLDKPLIAVYGSREYRIEPGDLVLFPPNQPHEMRKIHQESTFLCIQLNPSIFPATRSITVNDIQLRHYLSPRDDREVRRAILDVAQHYFLREELYDLYCWGQCGLLMHRLLTALPHQEVSAEEAAQIGRQNARLMRLVQFVEENYTHKIRLSDFARQEGCSVSYLSHFIHDRMNQTFQDYVNDVRFNHACKLMAQGEESMLSISMASGFSDYRYFSRAFQKIYGMTPVEYRDSARLLIPRTPPAVNSPSSQEHKLTDGQSLHILRLFQEQLEAQDDMENPMSF